MIYLDTNKTRLLILLGYVIARLADGQFERAGLVGMAGLAALVICNPTIDPLIARKR